MIEVERQVLKKLAPRTLYAPLKLKTSLSEMFHENTKLSKLGMRAYGAWIQGFTSSLRVRRMLARAYKVYSLMDQRELQTVEPRNELDRSILARRSGREYTGEAITNEELSRMLFFSYGKTQKEGFFRAVASGGGLYPLEVYVIALRVEGLEPGIYHYNVADHCLDAVRQGDYLDAIQENIGCNGIDVENAAAVFAVTAIFRRSTPKYQDRGYRFILMEAGAVANNLGLQATSMSLGLCQVGGFLDDPLSEMLDIDGIEEAPLVTAVVGRAPKKEHDPAQGNGSR